MRGRRYADLMITARGTRRATALALAGALLLGGALSGCSVIRNIVDTGGLPDGVVPTQSVPSDFPAEVPLIDGDVLLGISVPGDGEKVWNVTVKVDGLAAFETAKQQFTDACFEYSEVSVTDESSTGRFVKDPYNVVLVVSSPQGAWVANYTVTDAETGI